MRLATTDLETSPSIADVWGLWQNNVSLNQLREATKVISFAWKWEDSNKVLFYSGHHDGHEAMVQAAWNLLNEADVIVHYNGRSFDVKHFNREFVEAGLNPPSPYKQIDLMLAVKKQFRFLSNKLQHVSTQLGLEGKKQHSGHELWVKCMAGDDKAWSLMRAYNKQDVVLTEKLYHRILPWIPSHPHLGLYSNCEHDVCGKCGGTNLRREGYAYTTLGKFQQYQCKDCGGWSRGKSSVRTVDARPVAL